MINNFDEGLSFNDVLIEPRFSNLTSRMDTNLDTYLSKNIKLKIPLVSSNMDTVTEDKMAIAMAKLGGIGIIHRFCSIEYQVNMVKSVKKNSEFIIKNPICIDISKDMNFVYNMIEIHNYKSFLIIDVNDNYKLLGIITSRDIEKAKLENNNNLHDVMTSVNIIFTTDINISYKKAKEIMIKHYIQKLPIIDEKTNEVLGLITLKNLSRYEHNIKHSSIDKEYRLMVGAAIGVKNDFKERAEKLVNAGVDVLVIDIAHGHSILVKNTLQILKNMNLGVDIIAGNVCTKEGVKFLADAGADGIKVGIGGGSICLTRVVTGCGVPQLTAVMECAEEARKYNIPIIGDGAHCKRIGNIVKDLIFSNTVMLGGFLAGTDETPGKILMRNNERVKIVRGMAGIGANLDQKSKEGNDINTKNFTAEGIEASVKYKGPVCDVVYQILGGIRSGLSYMGVSSIHELHQNSFNIKLRKISYNGFIESGRHSNDKL